MQKEPKEPTHAQHPVRRAPDTGRTLAEILPDLSNALALARIVWNREEKGRMKVAARVLKENCGERVPKVH